MTDTSDRPRPRRPRPRAGAGPVPTVADRLPARRQRAQRRCSTGRSRATSAARWCCASRTPTSPATPPRATPRSSTRCAGSASTGTRAPRSAATFGPYQQSERFDIYPTSSAKLREAGSAYDCYCTTEEVEARRKASGSKVQGYDGYCRELTDEQLPGLRVRGPHARAPAADARRADHLRPTWSAARSPSSPRTCPTSRCVRANGDPLYTLVNPVDDALMGITHVLRGEDLLSSTPRQIALYDALAGHRHRHRRAPLRPPADRDGRGQQAALQARRRLRPREYVERGFLPEGLLNYLALLGWGIAEDRDVFTMDEMAEAFDIRRVNPNPARFDLKKCEAINAAHMRMLSIEEMTERVVPFLARGRVPRRRPADDGGARLARRGDAADPRADQHARRRRVDMLGFLFVDEVDFHDPADVAKVLDEDGLEVVQAAYDALSALSTTGRPRRSRRRCAPSWSRGSASSRATRSARCGSPSPAAGSRRRCSSRSSCSAGSSSLARHITALS